MRKFNAFTLAEVLITLGIIGVVAAMTMPTLINQTNGAQYKAAYKKALSAISQGVTLNVALEDISFADTTATNSTAGNAGKRDKEGTIAYVLSQRMNVVNSASKVGYSTVPTGIADGGSNTVLFFNDGSVFSYPATDYACTDDTNVTGHKRCKGFIDVNGLKGPNKVVACDSGSTPCAVKSPTDIYPVEFYDQTIGPNTDAARAVLYGK